MHGLALKNTKTKQKSSFFIGFTFTHALLRLLVLIYIFKDFVLKPVFIKLKQIQIELSRVNKEKISISVGENVACLQHRAYQWMNINLNGRNDVKKHLWIDQQLHTCHLNWSKMDEFINSTKKYVFKSVTTWMMIATTNTKHSLVVVSGSIFIQHTLYMQFPFRFILRKHQT